MKALSQRSAGFFSLLACLAVAGFAAAPSAAQPYPSRPIEVVNSFSPGGTSDLTIRALQAAADKVLGQPLVQTFRQGGGGIVGTSEVARSSADGYKLLIVTSGELTAGPNLAKTSYTIDSFDFIGRISSRPYGFVVRNDARWQSFDEFRKDVERQPEKYTIGTAPRGGVFLTAQHLIRRGGLKLLPVPYGGSGPYLTAVLGGHVDGAWAPLTSAETYIRAGQMRVLAVTGPSRDRTYGSIPTFKELGVDSPFVLWVGLVAPKGVPAGRLALLRKSLAEITKQPAFLEAADKMGVEVAYGTPEEFEKQVREEDHVFKVLAQELGLAPK